VLRHGRSASGHGRQPYAPWALAVPDMGVCCMRHGPWPAVPWTPACRGMGVRRSGTGACGSGHGRRLPFASALPTIGGMKAKPPKSPTLTAVNQHFDEENERFAKGMDKAFEGLFGFPHGHRGAVFCWLWDNREGVVHAMERHWLNWNGIARIATEDGLKGRWGEPPTGNAMRRVWVRVCVDLKWWDEREERLRQARLPG